MTAPFEGVMVPVPCRHKAEPPQFPGQTLRCLGGQRSSVEEPGPKGLGMLEPGFVKLGRSMLR